jgi:hypothetical protein
MPEYRIYIVGKDGHTSGPPTLIDYPDDQEAVFEARRVRDGRAIEVWKGDCVVVRFALAHD